VSRYQKLGIFVLVLVILAGVIDSGLLDRQFPFVEGLDIAGGIRVVMQINPKSPGDWPKDLKERSEKMQAIRKTIHNRIKGVGAVSEPKVEVQNPTAALPRLVIEIPGAKNPKEALDRIQKTASLEFYWLRDLQSTNNPMGKWRMEAPPGDQKAYIFSGPRGETIDSLKNPEAVLAQVVNTKTNPPILTGSDLLANARSNVNQRQQVVINIEFNNRGTEIFRKFTSRHVDDVLAVFFDGKLLTAPTINEPIPSGKAEISGFKSLAEARGTAELLNAGALPVPLKVIAKDTVEPTLGEETVKQVVLAGILGLVLVALFMAIYYKLPGIIADVALVFYTLFVIATFRLLHATMSLAGIAALIISIGMAVDANILIFERLKEELRSGKTLRAAIDAGFNRAFTAIFDSNMCTAITCGVLYWLGTPSVQSFATTLLLGVAISMFTAITVTRTILHLLVSWEWAQKPSLYGLTTSWMSTAGRTWDIVGKRKWWFALSAVLIVPGLVVLAMYGLKPGIEFKSGSSIQASFMRVVTLPEVRSIAAKYSPGLEPEVQLSKIDGQNKVAFIKTAPLNQAREADLVKELNDRIGLATNTYQITFVQRPDEAGVRKIVEGFAKHSSVSVTKSESGIWTGTISLRFVPDSKWPEIREAINAKYPVESVQDSGRSFDSVSTVEPTISRELTTNAFKAVVLASLLIVGYLSIRFAIGGLAAGVKFGVCAVIALIHDSAFLLGLFAILGKFAGWEVDSLFVTAVLTVIGFSVHDTIVVYDRIRENLRHRQRGENFEQLCNRSILQTLSRSINTSLTVVLTLAMLIAFGGPLLRHFYVALLVGIVIGTYSSIFNATQLVVVWDNLASKGNQPKKKAFEDKPLVAKSTPSPLDAPTTAETPAGEAVVEEKEPTDAQDTGEDSNKPARIKRKTAKKRRY
jgi:SecD/SecF fusion protein